MIAQVRRIAQRRLSLHEHRTAYWKHVRGEQEIIVASAISATAKPERQVDPVGIEVGGLSGCGSTKSGYLAARSQTATVTVTATSGQLSHSTTVTLTVSN